MKAEEYLLGKGIHPTEPIYWDLGNTTISLDELMDEFASKSRVEENQSLLEMAKLNMDERAIMVIQDRIDTLIKEI